MPIAIAELTTSRSVIVTRFASNHAPAGGWAVLGRCSHACGLEHRVGSDVTNRPRQCMTNSSVMALITVDAIAEICSTYRLRIAPAVNAIASPTIASNSR